jgi:hypothetical protein
MQTRLEKIKSTSRGCNASIAGSGITMTENHWNGARGGANTSPQNRIQESRLQGVRRCQMVDTSLTGMRCRATKEIRSHQGLVRRYSEGIIQYDMENLGRHLISVQWENGVIDYVYPLEIEILDQGDEPAFNVVN